MQGYIIKTQKVRDEDLLVTVLTENRIKTLYRFYGARHSNLLLGYKIDFEAHPTNRENLFQLRNVTHLTFRWIFDKNRYYIWQNFLQLLFKHLQDINEIDPFYYDLLEKISVHMEKESPKRVIVESYIKLLEFEGRLHKNFNCFICGCLIDEKVILTRAFLPSCKKCIYTKDGIKINKIDYLFKEKNSILLDDSDIDELYNTILEGL